MTQMREGLAAFRAMGAEILRPYLLALLADACGRNGQIERGLGALEEALVTAEQHGERFYAAELHRLQGELLLRKWWEAGATPTPRDLRPGHLASGETPGWAPLQREAEACFPSALANARRQGAKLLELRAALSLSRPWQQQGQRTAARQLLAEVYGWFTEGFESADLQEAQTLLESLA